jgi:hypothetical protein
MALIFALVALAVGLMLVSSGKRERRRHGLVG